MSILALQRLALEAFLDIFYFPLWWYGAGALKALSWCFGLMKSGNNRLAPGLWLANIFVPMFGQYDIQGRLVSFFMRFIQIIVRAFALLVWIVFCLILFFVWLAIPAAVIYGIYLEIRN